MAEAVAALSLAANILQVADFGKRFVGAAWKIWKSGSDGVEGFSSLQNLAQNLSQAAQELRVEAPPQTGQFSSARGIFDLAGECSSIAQEMLASLEKIKTPTTGKKRDAAIAGFKLAWKSGDIKALEEKLGRVQDQLTFNLAISLR